MVLGGGCRKRIYYSGGVAKEQVFLWKAIHACEEKGMQQERLSIHPYRGIVHTYRWLDVLSTIPDDQNTLTRQSADTNNAPRDPLLVPVTHPV